MASATSTPFNKQSSVLFDSVTQLVPPGHEKPLKQAFYTAAALFFCMIGTVAAISVYYILEAFIKPLLWALLCGSFIFPFKYSLHSTLESWLNGQLDSGRPLFAGAILLPFSLFDSYASRMGNFVISNWKMLAAVVGVLAVIYALYLSQLMHILFLMVVMFWDIVVFLWKAISFTLDICTQYRFIIMSQVVGYFVMAMILGPSPIVKLMALPMWGLLLVCIASVAGNLQVPVGISLGVLITVGVLAETKKQKQAQLARSLLGRTGSLSALLSPSSHKKTFAGTEDILEEDETNNDGDCSENSLNESEDVKTADETTATTATEDKSDNISPIKPVVHPVLKTLSEPNVGPASAGSLRTLRRRHKSKQKSATSIYFNLLFAAFGVVLLFQYIWLTILVVFPLLYWMFKKLLVHDTVVRFLDSRCKSFLGSDIKTISTKCEDFIESRNDVLMPGAIQSMVKLILKGDKKFHALVLSTLPTVTTIIIILFIFIGSVVLTIFLAVKVQQESFVIAKMTSDLINETVSTHPEYKTWLPDNETMENMMDSLVDNVYVQGREWISTMVNSSLGPGANVSLVEKQALKVWDRAYTAWFVHKNTKEKPPLLTRQSSSDVLSSDASGGLFAGLLDLLNMSEVIDLLKENMSALKSVGESIWTVLQSNISLISSSISTILTILLSGGSAILNFVLATVIFFTALFYLLVSSVNQYKPVELFGSSVNPSGSTVASTIASSIQAAIGDVFGASLKMASFYGLYTWLNHTTLGANLVYIPSVLAALFGVIPIFTTYWSCLPAVLEIWLLQGSLLRAACLLFLQFLPTMFVDAAIYGEMSANGGGHPYITGLAVVGGVYCYGMEGAIIGPIVLCCLLVVINVFTKIAVLPSSEESTQPTIHKPLHIKRSLSNG